ncbi:MAG TPA: hypothetical protein DFS52_17160 [Myxococcales bacterium]|nr:hypothetical protein [Myxococcales bacterium]
MQSTASLGRPFDERAYVAELIERIVRECPERVPTSEDERKAQEIMSAELAKLGLAIEEHPFAFNDNLYANLVLHFGLASAGTAVSGLFPLAGLLMHLTAGGSYLADSARRAYLLRRLLGFKPARNILATLPAKGEPKLRIVLAAHADAAFTGLLFSPTLVKQMVGRRLPGMLERFLALATYSNFALAGFDLLRVFLGPLTLPLRPLEALLTVPSALTFLINAEVALRKRVVPGANDNLSGVAALPVLASRLAEVKPPEVEIVFAVTGCEEASMGGADALARDRLKEWDRARTVVLALDSIANGELRYIDVEGEVVRRPAPSWLTETMDEVARSEPRFNEVQGYTPPVGGTDAAAFLAHGYDSIALICVDEELGCPRQYHLPTDDPEHLEIEPLMKSIDFTERFVHALIRRRLGIDSRPAAAKVEPAPRKRVVGPRKEPEGNAQKTPASPRAAPRRSRKPKA